MDDNVRVFAQVMAIVLTSIGALVAIGLGTRILWRMGSRAKPHLSPVRDDGRLERLEAAVDAIAIEVERISESQRFTVSLLSDRLPPRAERIGELPNPNAGKRVNTPH